MKISAIPCLFLLLSWNFSLFAESEPEQAPDRSVYVKIILPGKAPAGDRAPSVESWILKALRDRGEKEVRAVTDWVSLSHLEGESVDVWNAVLEGKLWGCPVDGLLQERTRDGRIHVSLSGWTPVGPTVETESLSAKPGSREILAVDLHEGETDPEKQEIIAYAVLSVGLPKTEKD